MSLGLPSLPINWSQNDSGCCMSLFHRLRPSLTQLRDVQEAAPRLGVQLVVLRANVESDFAPVFATLVQQRAEALLVCSSPFFHSWREHLVALAARQGCSRRA